MTEPRLNHVHCLDNRGLHRMAYWEWGERGNPEVLVCVHGLTRQGRDFDSLARRLARRYRVICPDVVGRGQSDWLRNPALYQIPSYVADMVTLLARLDVAKVDWVGTSMGGLIGMALGALEDSPIRRLVLNDVGPGLEYSALQRIGAYLGAPLRFGSVEEGAAYLRGISAGFGPHSEADWLDLSRPMFKPVGEQLKLHYDPGIAASFAGMTPELARAAEAQLWQLYDGLRQPTLLLRGAESDLVLRQTAEQMRTRGPGARGQLRWVEVPGCGHAPALNVAEQVDLVSDFIERA